MVHEVNCNLKLSTSTVDSVVLWLKHLGSNQEILGSKPPPPLDEEF